MLNSKETVADWTERLRGQVSRFLDFEGENAARVVNNLDWISEMSAIDFLRDVGKHYRLGTMLAKDTVARRLSSDEGISFTEFSYQILQGIDFHELYLRHGVTLQTGGNDQWGNLLSGVDLIRRTEGASVHVMTTPLITKADGTKFGKTEGGAVWLDADMMSPYAFYQFWLNAADDDVVRFLKIFTFRSREEIAELEVAVRERPGAREAQRTLAADVTTLVHGAAATEAVVAASQALFGRGDLDGLDERTLEAAVAELPRATAQVGDAVVDLLVASGLVASRGPRAGRWPRAARTSTTSRSPVRTRCSGPTTCCTDGSRSCAAARRRSASPSPADPEVRGTGGAGPRRAVPAPSPSTPAAAPQSGFGTLVERV